MLGALLTACGDGGPNNNPAAPATEHAPTTEQVPAIEQSSPPATLTGRFMAGPVSGLRYVTPSQSGYTNDAGEYAYLAGETVSFYGGDILIGEAAAGETITPFDLAGIEPPVTSKDINQTIRLIISSTLATPMDVVTNIAVFPQTLDEDGDPTNGQQIPAAMHNLAAGSSISMTQKYWHFRAHNSFRKLIASGRSVGLWGGSQAIRHPLIALDNLYSGLSLTPTIEARTTMTRDTWNDGTVDARNTYTYDLNGNNTYFEFNGNDDGIANSRSTYSYDDNGEITLVENDDDNDGTIDSRVTYTYDTNGLLVLQEYDYNGNGISDDRTSYTYDAFDYMVLEERDIAADGTIDIRITYTYDEVGNRTTEEQDTDADGTVNNRITYTYGANGKQTLIEYDNDADSTVDSRTRYAYDSTNYLTLTEHEINGVLAYRYTYICTYNESNGNATLCEADDNGDGTVDFHYPYTFDFNGNPILGDKIDTTGKVHIRTRFTYTPINKWMAAWQFEN